MHDVQMHGVWEARFFPLVIFLPQNKCICFALLTNTRITVVNHSIIQRMHLEHVRTIRYIQCIQITQFYYCEFNICINPISLKNTLSNQITYFAFVLLDMSVFSAYSKVFPLLTLMQFGFDFTKFAIKEKRVEC